jgi:hypothetical protein
MCTPASTRSRGATPCRRRWCALSAASTLGAKGSGGLQLPAPVLHTPVTSLCLPPLSRLFPSACRRWRCRWCCGCVVLVAAGVGAKVVSSALVAAQRFRCRLSGVAVPCSATLAASPGPAPALPGAATTESPPLPLPSHVVLRGSMLSRVPAPVLRALLEPDAIPTVPPPLPRSTSLLQALEVLPRLGQVRPPSYAPLGCCASVLPRVAMHRLRPMCAMELPATAVDLCSPPWCRGLTRARARAVRHLTPPVLCSAAARHARRVPLRYCARRPRCRRWR